MKNISRLLSRFIFSIDNFSFAQKKWFRKWYGGNWSCIRIEHLDTNVWVKGEPSPILREFKVIEEEDWPKK